MTEIRQKIRQVQSRIGSFGESKDLPHQTTKLIINHFQSVGFVIEYAALHSEKSYAMSDKEMMIRLSRELLSKLDEELSFDGVGRIRLRETRK